MSGMAHLPCLLQCCLFDFALLMNGVDHFWFDHIVHQMIGGILAISDRHIGLDRLHPCLNEAVNVLKTDQMSLVFLAGYPVFDDDQLIAILLLQLIRAGAFGFITRSGIEGELMLQFVCSFLKFGVRLMTGHCRIHGEIGSRLCLM